MDAALQNALIGLPIFLAHLGTALGLLIVGFLIYEAITPYREFREIRAGNTAAGVALTGGLLAMAIPLGACMANSISVPDILVWGSIAVLLQLATFAAMNLVFRDMASGIASGQVASALKLAAGQLSVGVLNAAAMS
jgi:putative membrane protein